VSEAPLRLLALVQKPPGVAPHQRFRLEQWAPHLARDHAITIDFESFESPELSAVLYRPGQVARKARLVVRDTLRRWARRHRAREFDAVVVMREATMLGGALVERAISGAGVPLLYDFDDAIWLPDTSGRNGVFSLARAPWKVAEVCGLAAAVTVGNAYLAAYARQHTPRVHVVRTSIDVDRFVPAPPPPAGQPFTIVWTGSHSTLAHLETIRAALEAVGRELPTRLRVICDVAPRAFEYVALDFVPWRAESEAADLTAGHVGVMPLVETPATLGKCGCKALQYMAVGRPAVVSPVGINREIVRDGENGLLATSLDAWAAQLLRLARDPALAARLAAAGRRTVLDGFTAAGSAAAFARVTRAAVERAPFAGAPSGARAP
jgi:glycosyltransferase involved in cell wall biosynthesis